MNNTYNDLIGKTFNYNNMLHEFTYDEEGIFCIKSFNNKYNMWTYAYYSDQYDPYVTDEIKKILISSQKKETI